MNAPCPALRRESSGNFERRTPGKPDLHRQARPSRRDVRSLRVHRRAFKFLRMPVSRLFAVILLFGLAVPASAADPPHHGCLNKAEQRAAVAEHRAIPLAHAVKSLRAHGRRAELVRARLCRRDNGLVYVLTLLSRSGKVTNATIDAASGEVINGR
jgi:hypothetical protein